MSKATITSRDLRTKSARARLKPREEPYWLPLDQGIHLGLRRSRRGDKWTARLYLPDRNRYTKTTLGRTADDLPADGVRVLDFHQAQDATLRWGRAQGAVPESGSVKTVQDALNCYLKDHIEPHRRAVADARGKLARIGKSLGSIPLRTLTRQHITRWHHRLAGGAPPDDWTETREEWQRRRRSTANRLLTTLKAALNFGLEHGHIATDAAWRGVKRFENVEAARLQYLADVAEARRFLNSCDPDFREIAHAGLLTGGRWGELYRLEVADYLRNGGVIRFRVTKSGEPRHVPLTDEGLEFFEAMTVGRKPREAMFLRTDGNPWGTAHQARRMKAACERAKIDPPVPFYALRHTYGAQLAMAGTPLQVIAAALGHADTRITEKHYAHLAPSYIADTVRANLPRITRRTSKVKRIR
jgi:integrase